MSVPAPRVLLTGASGFTGRHTGLLLQAQGFHVAGLGQPAPWVHESHACDLTDKAQVHAVVNHIEPDYVIHLAALSFVGHGDSEAFYRVNVFGTLNLLEALAALPAKPRKVLIASSANVYGTPDVEVIDESICPVPVNHYACSKLAMEHMTRTWFARLPIIITRPFNYTGVGQDERFLIPKIVSHFRRRESVIELGNLDVSRDFSDVSDVVAAYLRLMISDHHSLTLNICSGHAHSLREIMHMASELSGHRMEIRVNPAFVRANEIPRLVGSNALLRSTLGEVAQTPLKTTLQRMLTESAY